MKWSYRIGRLAGIDVYLHVTFVLFIAFLLVSQLLGGADLGSAVLAVGFVLAVFGCVVVHELGHALAARQFGIATRDITLLPIGGVARLDRMPDKPLQELWVAVAGPLVNVVIAVALYAGLGFSGRAMPLNEQALLHGGFLQRLMFVNAFLVVFNMLPAFPMDGGRVLRAILATWLDYAQATRIAATLGQGVALIFGFFGLFENPMLLFIALFVWIGAAQEAGLAQTRSALAGVRARAAMLTHFLTMRLDQTLGDAAALVLSGSQQDFPVLDGPHVVGVLLRKDLIGALSQRGPAGPVAEALRRDFPIADANEPLEAALTRAQDADCPAVPVLEGGRLIGLLTTENVSEFLMIQAALGRPGPRPTAVARPASPGAGPPADRGGAPPVQKIY